MELLYRINIKYTRSYQVYKINSKPKSLNYQVIRIYNNSFAICYLFSGFFSISPIVFSKKPLSYFFKAFLCSGRDISRRISFITITAYVVHSFQQSGQEGYFSDEGSSTWLSSKVLLHFKQILDIVYIKMIYQPLYFFITFHLLM